MRAIEEDKPQRQPPDDLSLARLLVRWLDDRFLDPLLGLVLPGAGDLASAALGLHMVRVAQARGLPKAVVARMLLNLGVDALVGSVPVLGDLFDIGWKANKKNLALLEARHPGEPATAGDEWLVVGAGLFFAATLLVPIGLLVWAISRYVL